MRSLNGSCVGAWDEIYASLYPVMQLDSASLHLARGRSPYEKTQPSICFHASMTQISGCVFSHCSLLCAEVVPHSPFGVDVFGVARAWFDLFAESSHMYVHGANISVYHGLIAPYVL